MPQSKFYQRYLASQASKREHNDDIDESTVVDVTAGGKSSKNGDKKERRGQIFNKTEVPKGGELMFIEKSETAKAFLISTLRDHYLFAEISSRDMEKIIGFMDKLSEIDTEDVEPLIFMNEKVNVLREDKVDQTLTKEDALLNAPKKDSDYFRIPKVLDK